MWEKYALFNVLRHGCICNAQGKVLRKETDDLCMISYLFIYIMSSLTMFFLGAVQGSLCMHGVSLSVLYLITFEEIITCA